MGIEYDEEGIPTIRLYGESEEPPVEGNPFTIRKKVGENEYEQTANPNYVRPSDDELTMFEEWKGIEGNIKTQLGYFEPEEIPSKISGDWESEYQKRTGLRWGLMESYATKQERQEQKAFMMQRASMYKNKLSSIKSDLSAARTMWKSDRIKKLKEDQLRLKKQQEIEGNPILNLYTKAKAGDMEAWNELYQMQKEAEEQQELKEKYKAAKEAAKPKKMTAAERYIAKNEEAELRELKKEIVKIQKKQELMGTLDPEDAIKIKNYQQKEEKYLKWLEGFEGTPNEEESPTKKLDTKKAATYLKMAKGDREAAKLLAIQDGYDVED
jgi:hypothetical protein